MRMRPCECKYYHARPSDIPRYLFLPLWIGLTELAHLCYGFSEWKPTPDFDIDSVEGLFEKTTQAHFAQMLKIYFTVFKMSDKIEIFHFIALSAMTIKSFFFYSCMIHKIPTLRDSVRHMHMTALLDCQYLIVKMA